MKLPSPEYIKMLFNKYQVPTPISNHCHAVTNVGIFLAERLVNACVKVDIALVEAGCLIHDAFKAATFEKLLPYPKDNYIPTDSEIIIWQNLYKQFLNKDNKPLHETLIASQVLKKEYPEFAKFVAQIGSTGNPSYLNGGIELKIIHYADWRVDLDKIVSFDDRLKYLVARYKDSWKKIGISWEEWYAKEKLLEKEIFDNLDFSPNELNTISKM